MEKHREAAFMIYFVLLFLLVINNGISSHGNLIDFVYLVVVVCCSLKYILIVNKDR